MIISKEGEKKKQGFCKKKKKKNANVAELTGIQMKKI